MSEFILRSHDLTKHFGRHVGMLSRPQPTIRAVNGVSLSIRDGEIFGLVGESGCGKSTLARTLLGLIRETGGELDLLGRRVSGLDPIPARRARRDIQYVHQDPGAALDPWWRIGATLNETLKVHGVRGGTELRLRVDQMLDAVGLDSSFRSRYPHELSGGQQRRIGLARTLSLRPRVVILDEPTSGLDLSVQATVLKLMLDLRVQFNLTYIFISHDLSVVHRMCDRVAIMYLGRIVEEGPTSEIFKRPVHPYTKALLKSAPSLTRDMNDSAPLSDEPPNSVNLPGGCAFRTRCSLAEPKCHESVPQLVPQEDPQHRVACTVLAPPEGRPATK